MKILITGAKGQLGNELLRCLSDMKAEIGRIPEAYRNAAVDAVDYDNLDITDATAVRSFMQQGAYDIVFNCAAMTNVDGCEANESDAHLVNAIGAKNIAESANFSNAKIVHVSTDYVFSGDEPGDRVESDPAHPLSAYGRTKLQGEKMVAQANPCHFIVRTAWLYGYVGSNFVKTMRRLGSLHSEVAVVRDQLGNPTSANDLAYELLKIALTQNYGVYHCTNNGTCSWADFAQAIMSGSNLSCKVTPVSSEQYRHDHPQSAPRPSYSSLKNQHLEDTVGDEMRPWQDALATYLRRLSDLEG